MNQTAFFNPPCRPRLGMVLGLAVLATACGKGAGSGPASPARVHFSSSRGTGHRAARQIH